MVSYLIQTQVSIHAPLRREERPRRNLGIWSCYEVSIHAPLRREERQSEISCGPVHKVSIHAPLRREERRGDCCGFRVLKRFNPRPPPKRGATRKSLGGFEASTFQSTPPSEERSDISDIRTPRSSIVSIHAPLRREERLVISLYLSNVAFQSTPPSEERSDPQRLAHIAVSGVSIHAPLRREERLNHHQRNETCATQFQSTPPSEERSDSSRIPAS